MRQQINLYQDLPQDSRYRISHKLFGMIFLGLESLIILMMLSQRIHLSYSQHYLKKLQQKVTYNQHTLRENAQLLQLQKQLQFNTNRLKSLPTMTPIDCYFSQYFYDLALAKTAGVWLTDINISLEKATLSFNGKALAPDLISNWLKKLIATNCFAKKSFALLTLTNQTTPTPVTTFTLNSAEKP